MAETKPTATAAKSNSTAQPKKSGNFIATIAPIACVIGGYLIWRVLLGSASNFTSPDPDASHWFWPSHKGPKGTFTKMYEGGIVVPILIASFLVVLTFAIERFLTIRQAAGSGNISEFIRKIQFHLANKEVDKAIAECDKQKGSVGNVMKSGLSKYKEMITNTELDTDQKVLNIQKEIEEATALELPMLEKNLVFLSTIASVATLLGLFGTVLGMIRYNTALGIGTSAVAIVMYNVFTTRIDAITYGIDESGFTLTQSFAANYK